MGKLNEERIALIGAELRKKNSEPIPFHHKPASCESYTSASEYPQASTSALNVVQREEFKVDMKPDATRDNQVHSPSRLRKLSSGWKSLKRRLSADSSNRPNLESYAHAYRSTEILPDDLEYIEGGDIVQEHLPHHEEVPEEHATDTSQSTSSHILTTVAEEKTNEIPNGNECNATDGGSSTSTNTNSSAQNLSVNIGGKPRKSSKSLSPSVSLNKIAPISGDTKF